MTITKIQLKIVKIVFTKNHQTPWTYFSHFNSRAFSTPLINEHNMPSVSYFSLQFCSCLCSSFLSMAFDMLSFLFNSLACLFINHVSLCLSICHYLFFIYFHSVNISFTFAICLPVFSFLLFKVHLLAFLLMSFLLFFSPEPPWCSSFVNWLLGCLAQIFQSCFFVTRKCFLNLPF